MQTITGISEKSVGSGRYVVFVDAVPMGHVSAAAIADLGLHVGDTLDLPAFDRLQNAIEVQAVFDKAVEMLAVSQRSSRGLERRLIQKGVEKGHVQAAIARLMALGYLNDDVFAESVVQSRLVEGGASRRRVQQDLFRKGIAREVADRVIQRAVEENETDERIAALQVARKRLKTLRGLDAATRKRRLYGFLARRGYDSTVISGVLRDLGAELATVASDDDGGDLGGDISEGAADE